MAARVMLNLAISQLATWRTDTKKVWDGWLDTGIENNLSKRYIGNGRWECVYHICLTTQQTPLCRSFQLSPLLKQDRPQRRPSFQKTALNEESPLRVGSFLVMKFDQRFKIVFL